MATPPYLVFIDGAAGGTAALPALARAMAAQYGMPVDDLLARLQHSRVRVRTTPDLAFAETTRRELEAIGARCVVTDSDGTVVGKPPDTGAVTAIASRAAVVMPSGLAAASRTSSQDLGAISSGAMSLSALDGSDGESRPAAANAFAPPTPPRPPTANADAFAPPPEDDNDIDMALDIVAAPRRTLPPTAVAVARTQTPVAVARTQTPIPLPSASSSGATGAVLRSRSGGLRAWLGEPTNRFALGVVVCLGLAFVPAHFIGRVRERPALATIDAALVERQAQVLTTDDWRGLDRTRATFLSRKEETRRDLALTTMAIWFVLAGGLGYVWFRKLDWDRLTA